MNAPLADAKVIDAHQHFWRLDQFDYGWLEKPEHAPIRRDFLPDDLRPELAAAGVARTVLVQTQHTLAENVWALDLADRHDFIAGVVGWVDLASRGCEDQLLEFMAHPKAVGIRHITQDEPDDNFIIREDILAGLAALERNDVPFDLLFHVKHLRHVPALANRFQTLPMVIDHLSKPHIKQRRLDDWIENFRAAARFPNVHCKLSGMVTEADWQEWKPADLKPYVETALECFGPARCMFGSDWPVCRLAANYGQVHAALDEVLGPISQDERTQIFGGTAAKFYGLT